MGIMVAGAGVYSAGLPVDNLFSGLPWIIFNMLLAVVDRLVQRSMLAQDQAQVDISLSGVTLLNNLWGCMFMLIAAVVLGESQELPVLLKSLGSEHVIWILCSCFVGTCISFTGIFVQKRISVLINVNMFGIIFPEAFCYGDQDVVDLTNLLVSVWPSLEVFCMARLIKRIWFKPLCHQSSTCPAHSPWPPSTLHPRRCNSGQIFLPSSRGQGSLVTQPRPHLLQVRFFDILASR